MNMSERIVIELDEKMSQVLYDKYESVKDEFDSFEAFRNRIEYYIDLSLQKLILQSQINELDKEIQEMENIN